METANLVIKAESTGISTVTRELDQLQRKGDKAERATDGLRKQFLSLKGVIAGLGLGLVAREVVQAADKYQLLNARLRLVSDSTEEATDTYNKLLKVANSTRTEFETNVELYTRLARSTENLNLSQDQLLQLTETINQTFKVSGASTAEAAAAITQLSQGFASGTLRGDEFNSVNEQAPRLMEAVAKAIGKERGELRALAADGKLTSETIAQALLGQAETIEKEFDQLPTTVGDALTQLRNDTFDAFGRTDTTPLVGAIQELRELVANESFRNNIVTLGTAIAKSIGVASTALSEFVELGEKVGRTAARIAGASDEIQDLEAAIADLEGMRGQNTPGIWTLFDGSIDFYLDEEQVEEQLKLHRDRLNELLAAQGFIPKGENASESEEVEAEVKVNPTVTFDDRNSKAIERRLEALKLEASVLGKSERETELYKLRLEGATEAELKAADASLSRIEAFEAAQEKAKEDSELAEKRKEEFEQLVEDLKSEEQLLVESYKRRKEIILRNTEENSEAQRRLLEQLNEDYSGDVLSGFGSEDDSFEAQEKRILEEYARRMELIEELEGDQTELEMELTRRRNDQLAELDAQRTQEINDGYIALLDVMKQYYAGMEGEEAAYARAAIQIGQTLLDEKKRESIQKTIASTQSAAMGAYESLSSIPYVGPALGAAAAGGIYIAGGAAVAKIAGLFDSGGVIPAGQYGIVGEKGPELVQGPANVTSRAETAGLAKSALNGSQGPSTVVNVFDPSLVGQWASTADGREAIMNVVADYPSTIQSLAGG